MEFLPKLYRSKMRLYRDRPDVLTTGRWWWCPPGAVAIPYLQRFGSLKFDSDLDKNTYQPLGEVEIIRGRLSGTTNPRFTGQRWCGGEEVWTQGALYSQRHTPALDEDGVPLCCAPPPLQGGAQVNGEGTIFTLPGAAIWLEPESLSNLADADPIILWPDSSVHQRTVFGPGGPLEVRKFSDSTLGLPFAQFTHAGTLDIVGGLSLGHQYAVYAVGAGTGPVHQTNIRLVGGGLGANPVLSQTSVQVVGADSHDLVAWPHTEAHPGFHLLAMRTIPFGLALIFDGAQVAAVSQDPRGVLTAIGLGVGVSLFPLFNNASWYELIAFDRPLTDYENALVVNYLLTKYALALDDVLYLTAGDALYLTAGDPLLLG